MANPYVYGATGSLGQRWANKEHTTTTRLNIGRLMCDHVKYALAKLMATEDADVFGTWENPFNLGGSAGYYLWWDATTGCAREKSGSAPSSETDGIEKTGGVV